MQQLNSAWDRRFLFRAQSEQDMLRWVTAINNASRRCNASSWITAINTCVKDMTEEKLARERQAKADLQQESSGGSKAANVGRQDRSDRRGDLDEGGGEGGGECDDNIGHILANRQAGFVERIKAPPGLGSGLTEHPVASSNAKMHAKLTVGGKTAAAPAVAEEDGKGTSTPPTEEWGCDFCDDTYITEREAEAHESVCSANPAVNFFPTSPIQIADSSVCPDIDASPSASSHDTTIPSLVEDTGPIGTDEMKADVPLGISLDERIQAALGGGGQDEGEGSNEEGVVQTSSAPGAAKAAQDSQSKENCESRRLETTAGQEPDEVKKGDADGLEQGRLDRDRSSGSGSGGSGSGGSAPPSVPSSPPPPSLQQPTAERQHPARQQDGATGGVADAANDGPFPAETPVVIKGLQSASGSRLNGKAATVHPDQSGQKPGRVAVVLVGEGVGVGGAEGEGVPREQISIKRSNLFLRGS